MNENHDERGRFATGLSAAHAKLDKLAGKVHAHAKAFMRDQSGGSRRSADEIGMRVTLAMHKLGVDDPATAAEIPATRIAGHVLRIGGVL